MSSATLGRAFTIALLLGCTAFGAYATLGTASKNGLFDALGRSAGYHVEEQHFLGGPTPQKTTYTHIKFIDRQLVFMNSFFVLILDCPKTWDVTVAYWWLMSELCAAWMFIRIEGHREANQHGHITNWTGAFGLLMQNFTFAVTTPIYFIIYLLTSRASGTSPVREELFVNNGDTEFLPHRTFVSYIIPVFFMSLPSPSVLSAGAHYTWLTVWQFFPAAHAFYHFQHWFAYNLWSCAALPGHILGGTARRDLANAQKFILYVCFVPRAIAAAIALTPASLAPVALKPFFEQVTLGSVFVPYWPWDSPLGGDPASPAGKADLFKLFLQWDVLCGGAAILVWAVFVYLVSMPGKGLLRDVVPKVLTYGVAGGPIAVATLLMMERDVAVLGPNDGQRRKKY